MKIHLYTLDNCNYCEKIKNELSRLPKTEIQPTVINSKNATDDLDKYDIQIFPTMIWLSDNGRVLKRLDGFHVYELIIQTYKEAKRLETIQKKVHKDDY